MSIAPRLNYLLVERDDDDLDVFAVSYAFYNVYEADGRRWLSFFWGTQKKESPLDDLNYAAYVEINLPIELGGVALEEGSRIKGSAYDDEVDEWLTTAFYYAHGGFEDPVVEIQQVFDNKITACIRGEIDYNPTVLYAEFHFNSDKVRTIS